VAATQPSNTNGLDAPNRQNGRSGAKGPLPALPPSSPQDQQQRLPQRDLPETVWKGEEDTSILASHIHAQYMERYKDDKLLFHAEITKINNLTKPDTQFTKGSIAHKNKSKNRYQNIYSSDYARVKLNILDDDPSTDYINASYMHGYKIKNKFIAAQGPLCNKDKNPSTEDDFWRMVWEQRSVIIVMLAQVFESYKSKCAKYWPEVGETRDTGTCSITGLKEFNHGSFVRRYFTLTYLRTQESREVSQFQFLVWPDHGVPISTTDLFRFRNRTMEAQPDDNTPMIVHCSAGVGRTGTFIGMDYLIQQLYGEAKIDVYTLLMNMRLRRSQMVQSTEQYAFLHKLVHEWKTLGKTEATVQTFQAMYDKLKSTKCFAAEFKALNTVTLTTTHFLKRMTIGLMEENKHKNRDPDIIPYLDTRLVPSRWSSDNTQTVYLNASRMQLYDHSVEIIATQSPMKSTVQEFWRVVEDYSVQGIVMLNKLDPENEELDHQYWPLVAGEVMDVNENISIRNLSVTPDEECPDIVVTELEFEFVKRDLLERNLGKGTRQICHLQYTGWENADELPAGGYDALLRLRELCNDKFDEIRTCEARNTLSSDQMNKNKHKDKILFHCTEGCGRTGVFLSVVNTLAYADNEQLIDVARSIKDLRDTRMGMVRTLEQYETCYELVSRYIKKLAEKPTEVEAKKEKMEEDETAEIKHEEEVEYDDDDSLDHIIEPLDLMKEMQFHSDFPCSTAKTDEISATTNMSAQGEAAAGGDAASCVAETVEQQVDEKLSESLEGSHAKKDLCEVSVHDEKLELAADSVKVQAEETVTEAPKTEDAPIENCNPEEKVALTEISEVEHGKGEEAVTEEPKAVVSEIEYSETVDAKVKEESVTEELKTVVADVEDSEAVDANEEDEESVTEELKTVVAEVEDSVTVTPESVDLKVEDSVTEESNAMASLTEEPVENSVPKTLETVDIEIESLVTETAEDITNEKTEHIQETSVPSINVTEAPAPLEVDDGVANIEEERSKTADEVSEAAVVDPNETKQTKDEESGDCSTPTSIKDETSGIISTPF